MKLPANYPSTAADYLELARLEAKAAFALGPVCTLTAEDRAYGLRCLARARAYRLRASAMKGANK